MSMQVYPAIVITNIVINEFFPYRGFKPLKEYVIDDDEIISSMEKFGFIRIDGINIKKPRNTRNHITFIILKSSESNNPELRKVKKIIEDIDNEDIHKNNKLDELFIVTNKEFFEKKNFNDILKELYNRQKGGPDMEGEAPFYTICPYHNFAFSVPKCSILIPHILMTKDEVNTLLQGERLSMRDLHVILSNDINIIWNGGRIGELVRIIRNSETALLSVCYRRIESYIH